MITYVLDFWNPRKEFLLESDEEYHHFFGVESVQQQEQNR